MSKWIGGIVPHLPQVPAVKAIRVTNSNQTHISAWCNGTLSRDGQEITVKTNLGHEIAQVGDWIFHLEDDTYWVSSSDNVYRAEQLTVLLDG